MGHALEEMGMPEIPSEFIEPYLRKFLMIQIEGVACGLHTPEQVRGWLKGVDYFIGCFGGIHSRFATRNQFDLLTSLSDKEMIELCQKVYKD